MKPVYADMLLYASLCLSNQVECRMLSARRFVCVSVCVCVCVCVFACVCE